LVAAQVALSLPLLVSAGLLAQTIYNLQRTELGFHAEQLLLARVDISDLVHDTARRDRVLRELQNRIRAIPGVEAASFSLVGLFSGGISTAAIEVGGSASTAAASRDTALDRVGADYFMTLRVPVLAGRDISQRDRADTQKVCVVNQAFAQQYFGSRNPLGMRVTTIDDDVRTTYEVVGVAGNARTQSVRDDVESRFFVPAEQRPTQATSRTFIIRAESTPRVTTAVREAMSSVDPALTMSEINLSSIDEQMEPFIADERTTARLAVVFGTVALILAAVGLYGVLSYGVTRRAREIAIRMAVGAEAGGIIALVLRETARLIMAGLLIGGVLAYAVSRAIESRLYGVTARDPLTLILAMGVLLLAATAAAYFPARRAARVDPLTALRYE